MGDTFRLAMQLTMVDLLSGVANRAKANIQQLGAAGKEAAKNFEQMERHATRGLKALAMVNYTINKIKPGVSAAADMQESTDRVEMNLLRSTKNAMALHNEMKAIRDTAIFVGGNTPFTAKDVIDIEGQLLKSGISLDQVTGQKGAAWTAAGLSALSGIAPGDVGTSLAKIGQTFNLKSGEEYKAVADWLEKADSSAGQDLGKLFYGFQRAGNAAHNLGISPKELTTMLTIAAPMGEEAGTGIKMFLERLSGSHKEEQKYIRGLGLNFWAKDKTGKFLGVENAINEVKTKLAGVKNEHLRQIVFSKIFREEGGAFAKLVADSDKTFKQWDAFIDNHKDINEKMAIWGKGYNASLVKLVTTVKSSGASVFGSWLVPLTKVDDLLNNVAGKVGEVAENHPKATDTFNGVLAGVVGAGASYGAYHLIKAAVHGGKVLKGLRGLSLGSFASTGVGIAEGKIVQAATGTTPVFVTNWPATLGGSAIEKAADLAVGGATAKKAYDLVKGGGWLAKSGMGVAAAELGLPFAVGAAGLAAGYGAGTLLNSGLGAVRGWSSDGKYKGAGWAGEELYDAFHPQAAPANPAKNEIVIHLNVDGEGRVSSRANTLDTSVKTLPRGNFFGVHTWD